MGQYFMIVNLDKEEYIHPHKFGDGLKLLEFGLSSIGTMTALAILLSSGNGRGSGDLHSDRPVVGSWAGDRIVIAGDYDDEDLYCTGNLYEVARSTYKDISIDVLRAMADDEQIKKDLWNRLDTEVLELL